MDIIKNKKKVIDFGRKEHLLYGIFLGWMLTALLDFTLLEKILFYPSLAAGCLLPDIDIPSSTYGSRIKPISKWINKTVGHRTVTHSLFFITVLYFSYIIAFGMDIVSSGLMVGSVMHIFFDLFSKSGVPLAYPLSNKIFRLN